MMKQVIISCCVLFFLCDAARAQKSETVENAQINTNEVGRTSVFFKPLNPDDDKKDMVDIIGIGAATFVASNLTDGTIKSFKHTQEAIIKLLPAGNKAGTYQLIFYPENSQIKEAAYNRDGVLSIYYPLSMFTTIKSTLEQYIAAHKKITVKVVQQKDGYREGSIIF